MEKIIIPVNGTPKSELLSGLSAYISYNSLIPHLNKIFNVKPNETIIGLIVDKDGLTIRLDYK